jgi:tRNA dimethylallyltransferase
LKVSDPYPVFIICGPTATGKSKLGLDLADIYKGEVVNADSRQVYAGMDIGTGKLSPDERGVRHHLLDIVRPDEPFSAQEYRVRALKVLEDLKKRGKRIFVAGGTGLYLKALTEGLFAGPGKTEMRKELEMRETVELHRELMKVDPAKAEKLAAGDRRRIIRALEVFYFSGKPMSAIEKKRSAPAGFRFVWAGLNMERKKLYERIEARIDAQFYSGWVDEVRRLKKEGFQSDYPAFRTIGYPEVYRFLAGELSQTETMSIIKQKTRNYAKRQLTWFKHQAPVRWFDAESADLTQQTALFFGLTEGT